MIIFDIICSQCLSVYCRSFHWVVCKQYKNVQHFNKIKNDTIKVSIIIPLQEGCI